MNGRTLALVLLRLCFTRSLDHCDSLSCFALERRVPAGHLARRQLLPWQIVRRCKFSTLNDRMHHSAALRRRDQRPRPPHGPARRVGHHGAAPCRVSPHPKSSRLPTPSLLPACSSAQTQPRHKHHHSAPLQPLRSAEVCTHARRGIRCAQTPTAPTASSRLSAGPQRRSDCS